MTNLNLHLDQYLNFCNYQKRLNSKTLKAYYIDLKQFFSLIDVVDVYSITSNLLEEYIIKLHEKYKPKTVKRKIASIKAFFTYLEYKDIININPFNKVHIKFREPVILPKVIPLNTIELFLKTAYSQLSLAKTKYQKRNALRDTAVIELLFATGMRISELCSLSINDVNLEEKNILIYGKGSKERVIQIGSNEVIYILKKYQEEFLHEIQNCNHFFASQSGNQLSDQSIRRMIRRYSTLAAINMHITPHMFRHTFATCLLEADVDIRYIQEMLGHSSINITQIYTHVTMAKQRDILMTKHPRKNFSI